MTINARRRTIDLVSLLIEKESVTGVTSDITDDKTSLSSNQSNFPDADLESAKTSYAETEKEKEKENLKRHQLFPMMSAQRTIISGGVGTVSISSFQFNRALLETSNAFND
jgi:hypothetical protein